MDDVQMLEKLFAMASAAGEGAFWLAVLMIFKGYVSAICGFSAFIIVALIFKRIFYQISFLSHIADICGCSIPLSSDEKRKINRIVESGIRNMYRSDE